MKIKNFLKLGGSNKSKAVMGSRVLLKTNDNELQAICSLIWDLVVSTYYLNDAVFGVLVQGLTHDEASEQYNVKKSYLRNLVGLEDKRLEDDVMVDLEELYNGKLKLTKVQKGNLRILVESLIETSKPREDLDVYNQFTLPLGDIKLNPDGSGIADDVFINDLKTMELFSKRKAFAMKETRENNLGYYLYLLQTSDRFLSEEDLARKHIIQDVWWIR